MPTQNQTQTSSTGDGMSQGAQGQAQGQQTQTPGQQGQQQAPTFDTWLSSQPADVQTLLNGHIEGLRNTVQATRTERDTLSAELKKLSKGVEKGSDLEKQLAELTTQVEAANAKAVFFEAAPAHECKNAKAAFALMTSLNLTTRSGEPDWDGLKREAPELFGKVQSDAKAGAGTGQGGKTNPNQAMNEFIRGGRG
jgi:hypothetical protein